MTFEEFAREWFHICVQGAGLSESQIESDESILRLHLIPRFGARALESLKPRDIDLYKADKRSQAHQYGVGYEVKTVNNHLSVLHRLYEKAMEYELVQHNPVTKRAWLKPSKTVEDSTNWWTPADERRAVGMLASWRERYPMRRLVILVQVMTGMRFSEIRALEVRDFDASVPGLWVRRAMPRKLVGPPKNKKARLQVIPRELAEELEEYVSERDDDALMFRGKMGGPLANNCLNRWYRKLAQEAGVRPISSHGARHTSGSTYATMGASQKMIAKLLGHVSTKATERYTHVQIEEGRTLVEKRWGKVTHRL